MTSAGSERTRRGVPGTSVFACPLENTQVQATKERVSSFQGHIRLFSLERMKWALVDASIAPTAMCSILQTKC